MFRCSGCSEPTFLDWQRERARPDQTGRIAQGPSLSGLTWADWKTQGVTALAAKTKSKAPSIVSARAQHEQDARLPTNEICNFELHSLLVRKQLIPGSAKKTAAQTSTQSGYPLSPRDNIVNFSFNIMTRCAKTAVYFAAREHFFGTALRKNGCFFRRTRTLRA